MSVGELKTEDVIQTAGGKNLPILKVELAELVLFSTLNDAPFFTLNGANSA